MKRYIALLRGVNMIGKNKIAMAQLREALSDLGFEDVKTHLNSGNVILSSSEDEATLSAKIEAVVKERFSLIIPVLVISKDTLEDILRNAPAWWGGAEKEIYDNIIFIMPPATFSDVYAELGEPKAGLEQIENYACAIFWSFSRKDYRKTAWWSKTATAKIAHKLTIRSANTVRKLAELAQ